MCTCHDNNPSDNNFRLLPFSSNFIQFNFISFTHLLIVRHSAHIIINPCNNLWKIGIIPILRLRKARLIKATKLTQVHTVGKRQGQKSKVDSPKSHTQALPFLPCGIFQQEDRN
jgi:hypothetical protein